MTGEMLSFWVMAAAAVACAVGMVSAKNPIHAALWLVGNFISLAVIYLLLSAELLFAVQLIVYAGAIMVLFLFVIMFFMAPEARRWLNPPLRGQLTWGGIASVALLMLLVFAIVRNGDDLKSADPDRPRQVITNILPSADMGNPQELGVWMFSYQVLPFELTSILLLAALLGAMMVARDAREEGRGKVVHFAPVAEHESPPQALENDGLELEDESGPEPVEAES